MSNFDCDTGHTCSNSRFIDNNDGTITDRRTCLEWEKKTGTVEVDGDGYPILSYCPGGPTCDDPHNVNNAYSWSSYSNSLHHFDGSAATDFVYQLNSAAFAGHTDWRLPTVSDGRASDPEWESIFTVKATGAPGYPFPDCGGPCIYPVFNPAVFGIYWTANSTGMFAILIGMNGFIDLDPAVHQYSVRAVRGGVGVPR